MRIFSSLFRLILCLGACAFVLGVCQNICAAGSDPEKRREILILHSYSPDYQWTQSEQRGLDSVLDSLALQYKVRIEYMDSNHSPQLPKGTLLRQLYKEKFAHSRFQVIITTDNAALDFIREYRAELFPGVPVVFCGVNGYEPAMIKGLDNVTGVAEDNDFLGLFELILKLQPATRQIVIYGVPDDPSHIANTALIRKLLPSFRHDVKVEIREFPHIDACIEDAKTLPQNSVILMVGSMRTADGLGINLQRANELMSPLVSRPVYTAWDFGLNHGAVGGLVMSGPEQGRLAAEIALRIINGEDPRTIPVLRNSTNFYMFDYQQMIRFGLNMDNLPRGSKVFNSPEKAYRIPRAIIGAAAISLAVLSIAVIVLFFNIRRRKSAEVALLASQEKYAKAFRNSVDVIGIARLRDGLYIEVSDAFFRTFGYTRDEVIGKRSAAFGSEDQDGTSFGLWKDAQVRSELLRSFESHGLVRNLEVTWCTRTGEERIGLYSAEVISIGGSPSVIFVWHDITDRKRAEEERLDLEDRLRQAHKMESIGLLAGGVAHDFNNLLSPILGYSEILIAELQQGDPRVATLQQIRHAAERAATLTQQLLAFSRKQMLELRVVDLGAVVKRFEQMLRRTVREDIRMDVRYAPAPGLIRADVGQIEQVLMNLVVNAQDAMPNGGILTIEIQHAVLDDFYVVSHPDAKAGPHVVLVVSDTGIGIDEKMHPHLFEPFFTTKEMGKGTGLGLSTVYGIVKQHGGSISVYSEAGKGSAFRVLLPLVVDESVLSDEPVSGTSELPGGTETILVVEDNDMVRNLAVEMLHLLGYRVLPADGPISCFEFFDEHRDDISLLLTDVIMPKMNGKEIFTRLAEQKPHLKVLYMSGYTSNVIGHHGVLDEGVNLLQKPLSLQSLAEKVRHVLDS